MGKVPDQIRQQVIDWPAGTQRGAVEKFCATHGVSRAWFYKVRALAAEHGQAAMIKKSTRPRSTPSRVSRFHTEAVLAQREKLKAQGKDYGAESVLFALGRQGMEDLPSRSTVVRIFDQHHVVDRNRKKRPKRSFRRFAAKFANQRWQSDAYVETLADGAEVTVVEILDDATRYSLEVRVAPGESSEAVVGAFRAAVTTHGRPVLVHSDNGMAYNRNRYNVTTALVAFLDDLGVKTITGRPWNPRSQGKVERSHQTLQQFVAAHRHRCSTMGQLEQLLRQEYQPWYNDNRAHQSLGRETTPADLYHTIPKVRPPGDPITPALPDQQPAQRPLAAGTHAVATRTVNAKGAVNYRNRQITVGKRSIGDQLHLIEHPDRLEFFDTDGTSLATLGWPTKNKYPTIAKQLPTTEVSTNC